MRFFVDTEFDFDAERCTVTPVSVGIVSEDGHEYYAIDSVVNRTTFRQACSRFVLDHVLPVADHGPGRLSVKPREEIAAGIREFVGPRGETEFWGDYAAFDYVVLSIIMGGFDAWPNGWPMTIRDLQETPAGREASGSVVSLKPHHALFDARAVKSAYDLAFGDAR